MRDFLRRLNWFIGDIAEAVRTMISRAYHWLRDASGTPGARPAEREAAWWAADYARRAEWEAMRRFERRELRFVERREMRLADRQAWVADRQALLATHRAQQGASEAARRAERLIWDADRRSTRRWSAMYGVVALAMCAVLLAFVYSRASVEIHPGMLAAGGYGSTTNVSSTSVTDVGLTGLGWTILGAGLVFLPCAAFFVMGSTRIRVATGVVAIATSAVAGSTALSLFKGGALLKIDRLQFTPSNPSNFSNSSGERGTFGGGPSDERVDNGKTSPDVSRPPVELSLEISVKQDKAPPPPTGLMGKFEFHCKSDKGLLLQVGPFVSGRPDDLEKSVDLKSLGGIGKKTIHTVEDLVSEIGDLGTRRQLAGVMLVGSADKTRLTPETERLYDSNFALAQLRARWVEKQLLAAKEREKDKNEGDRKLDGLSTILVFNAGPTHVGPVVLDEQLDDDRSVRACIMVQPLPRK